MKPTWKKYLLYGSLIIVGGGLVFMLVETIRAKNTGFETKNLWDWMELLIIPFVLALGAFFLNRSERENERKIATDRQQEAALQAYLDRMSELLLEKRLRITKSKEVREVARAQTLTVLRGLDGQRKGMVLRFLYESSLINQEKTIITLDTADLTGAELLYAVLRNTNLKGAYLAGADLRFAQLNLANLAGAILNNADLRGALFEKNDMTSTNLRGANLHNAYLSMNDMKRIETEADLTGAIMPDGTKHD